MLELAAQLAGLQSGLASRRATREVGPAPAAIMRPSDFGSSGGTPQLSRQMSAMMSVSGPGGWRRRLRRPWWPGQRAAARIAAAVCGAMNLPGAGLHLPAARAEAAPPAPGPQPTPTPTAPHPHAPHAHTLSPLPSPPADPDGLDSLPLELLAFSLSDARVGVLSVKGRKVTDTRPRRPTSGMIANMELVATAIASVGSLVFLGDADGSLVVWDTVAGKSSMLTTGWVGGAGWWWLVVVVAVGLVVVVGGRGGRGGGGGGGGGGGAGGGGGGGGRSAGRVLLP